MKKSTSAKRTTKQKRVVKKNTSKSSKKKVSGKAKAIGNPKPYPVGKEVILGRFKTPKPPKVRMVYKKYQEANFKIGSSRDAYEFLIPVFGKQIEIKEQFFVLLCNNSNLVLGHFKVGEGGINSTLADLRLIFAGALASLSTAIVLAHNHPSGNLTPSDADLKLTRRIKEAGVLLEIKVLDHIILSPNKAYYSFADEGNL